MKITKSEFIKSAAGYDGFIVSDHAQIVVAGRSNVGKSSFINFLTNNGKMAKTSNTPGRTRLVNYFLINDFMLVDLPGYGYAKGAKFEIKQWGQLMDDYFRKSPKITHVIMLVDIRHMPSAEDMQFMQYLNAYRIPFSVVATKSDKLSRMQINEQLNKISTALMIGRGNIFAISSSKKTGLDQVLTLLDKVLTVHDTMPQPVEEIEEVEEEEISKTEKI